MALVADDSLLCHCLPLKGDLVARVGLVGDQKLFPAHKRLVKGHKVSIVLCLEAPAAVLRTDGDFPELKADTLPL
jgi:hypothetical protein